MRAAGESLAQRSTHLGLAVMRHRIEQSSLRQIEKLSQASITSGPWNSLATFLAAIETCALYLWSEILQQLGELEACELPLGVSCLCLCVILSAVVGAHCKQLCKQPCQSPLVPNSVVFVVFASLGRSLIRKYKPLAPLILHPSSQLLGK